MQRNLYTIDFELEENRYHIEDNRLQQRSYPTDHPMYASLAHERNILLSIRANLINERLLQIYGKVMRDERIETGKF